MKIYTKQTMRSFFPFLSIAAMLILASLVFFNIFWYFKGTSANVISKDIENLVTIFKKIDAECKILGFDMPKVSINFLTVKKDGFTGSEIGSMHLAHPEKWQGPYVESTPHIQGKEYQIITTQQGVFITPGDGVRLPSGPLIGKDIVLNERADIIRMMKTEKQLLYKGKLLAAQLPIQAKLCMSNDQRQIIFSESD